MPSRRASSRSSWPTSSPRRWRTTRWPPSRACTCRTTTACSCPRRTASSSPATSRRCARSCRTTCSSTPARSRSRSPPGLRWSSTPTSGWTWASSGSRLSCWHLRRGGGAGAPAAPSPSAGDFGHTMVYSPDREARRLDPALDRRQALLVGGGRRNVLGGSRVVVGRSREADIVLARPERVAATCRAPPRRERLARSWTSARRTASR